MIRVMVAGAAGRMGQAVVAAVADAEDMEPVALVDPALEPGPSAFHDVPGALARSGAEVAVDFTRPDAVFANARAYLAAGVHGVIGTTGLSDDQIETLGEAAEAGSANLLIAPNFAVGAVLMMRFAAEASRHMASAEIIELHHDGKLDAPSGTALRTAAMMAGEPVIHSVRLPGLVAHQAVMLGGLGETLTIRHDSLSRDSFMPGVLMAVRAVRERPGLTVGLEPVLFDGPADDHP